MAALRGSMRGFFWGPILILCLVACSSAAHAFDCAKAYLPVDFVICSDPAVLKVNEAHEKAWYDARARLSDAQKQELLDGQRRWLKEFPPRCGVPAQGKRPKVITQDTQLCVAKALDDRKAFLEQYTGATTAQSSPQPGNQPYQGAPATDSPSAVDADKAAISRLQAFGLIGVWSHDCAKEPSEDNFHLWFKPHRIGPPTIAISTDRKFSQEAIDDVETLDDTKIRFRVRGAGGSGTIEKVDEEIRFSGDASGALFQRCETLRSDVRLGPSIDVAYFEFGRFPAFIRLSPDYVLPRASWWQLIDDGLVRVRELQKTNGMPGEMFGHKTYTMWYRVELEVVEPFSTDYIHTFVGPCNGRVVKGTAVPKGAIFRLEDTMGFYLTENGWKGEDHCANW